jgi:RNA polymerase sigma factor (TIGR02999 family)
VYDELRKLAGSYLRGEKPGHTLQPTALAHEAYLRMVDQNQQNWQNRSHFFGVAAHLMRLILVDHARKNRAGKRGGGANKVEVKEVMIASPERPDDVVALDEALTKLAGIDERKAKIIEMRYFGGMTVEETAHALGISTATVARDTQMAQLWLCREIKSGE